MNEEILRRLVDAIAPLMDEDFCQPFMSAWELDPHVGYSNGYRDGEEIYAAIFEAWEAAEEALQIAASADD